MAALCYDNKILQMYYTLISQEVEPGALSIWSKIPKIQVQG